MKYAEIYASNVDSIFQEAERGFSESLGWEGGVRTVKLR